MVTPVVHHHFTDGTCYRRGYTHWRRCVILSVLLSASILIRCTGFMERGFFATWSYELEQCVGTSGSQKDDLGIFAPYG